MSFLHATYSGGAVLGALGAGALLSWGVDVEDWYQSDDLGMMQQLGVIPSDGGSEEVVTS